MDTRHKGELAQLQVQVRVAEKGWFCSKPTMEGCRYDLIVDDGDKLHRVQVKYCDATQSRGSGCMAVGLRKRNGGKSSKESRLYTAKEVDAVVVYFPRLGKLAWLPRTLWENKAEVNLRISPSLNNQKKGIRLLEDFVW